VKYFRYRLDLMPLGPAFAAVRAIKFGTSAKHLRAPLTRFPSLDRCGAAITHGETNPYLQLA
jgi:hypothetical protein